MTLTASAAPLIADPTKTPNWQYAVYVPGESIPKGSMKCTGGPYHNIVDKPSTRDWMVFVATYASAERLRRASQGDLSFPYDMPVKLRVKFVFDRPRTQPDGPPIVRGSARTREGVKAGYGDLDKLIRAVGDALGPGRILDGKGKSHLKAAIIRDDCLITIIEAQKAFCDEVGNQPAGAYIWLNSV